MIADAHLHLFSKGVFAFYARQVEALKGASDPASAAAATLGLDPPPAEPEALAARWVAELDRHGVARAALFGSAPGEHRAVAAAARAFPGRYLPFQMINPRAPDAAERLSEVVEEGMRGLLLFPALHGYFPDDEVCRPVYHEARARKLVVFVHVGRLKIAIRDRLGISEPPIDEQFGDPQRLAGVLREFPDVAFIVPHFGCGTLAGLLSAISGVRNLYLDSSSSNSWMGEDKRFRTLETVFRTVLEHPDLGPARVLFGSDSTVFPRGWRADVYERQAAVLTTIGAPAHDRDAFFGGNLARLLP